MLWACASPPERHFGEKNTLLIESCAGRGLSVKKCRGKPRVFSESQRLQLYGLEAEIISSIFPPFLPPFFFELFSSFPASSSHCPQNRWATSRSTTPGSEDGVLALLGNGNRSRCCREPFGLAPWCQLARTAIYCICAQTSVELINRWLQLGRLVGRGGCLHTQQNQRW